MDEALLQKALRLGEITLRGQFVAGSNATFLADCDFEGFRLPVVYKPIRGQAPLWDFDRRSLPAREVAAWRLAGLLGWDFVPVTILRRRSLPLGAGSLQIFIDHDPSRHYFNFSLAEKEALRPIALFDVIANNADRKGGHLLLDGAGKCWAIDHALCFHPEPKLRSVIWDFAGEALRAEERHALERLEESFAGGTAQKRLNPCLPAAEIIMIRQRNLALLQENVFPLPVPERRNFPWPLV